jgi:hypothetical protein
MSRKTKIEHKDGLYFITFTCAKWISLFEITKSYDLVYNWFDILKKNGSFICGYVCDIRSKDINGNNKTKKRK